MVSGRYVVVALAMDFTVLGEIRHKAKTAHYATIQRPPYPLPLALGDLKSYLPSINS
jgi:hypothetical protein